MKVKLIKESLVEHFNNEFKTGREEYPDEELVEKYDNYENRKYELGLKAAKDFLDLKNKSRKEI